MRTLDELTQKETEQLLENYPTFREHIEDMCLDVWGPAYSSVDEYTHNAPVSADYEIGGYSSDYFRFRTNNGNDLLDAAEYCAKIQKDFYIFGDETEGPVKTLARFKKYAGILIDAENGYINMKDKDYDRVFSICETYANLYAEMIKDYCSEEYKYFRDDIWNCITYCEELEMLNEYRITDDLQLVNLEELEEVFKKQGLIWDRDTIESFMETALETMQNS